MGGRTNLRRIAVTLFAALFALGLTASDSEARRKGKRKGKKKAVAANVNAEALGELMGAFKFGMTKDDVLKVLAKQISDRYEEKVKETTDVYSQDKLRRDKKKEVARIKKSFTKFAGKKTGWDVSIVDDQFAHGSDESMMVYWENEAGSGKDQRRFFFFHDGRLYKMFIALNSSMLKGEQKNFAYFQNIMSARYGDGTTRYETDRNGVETPAALAWKTSKFRVEALDRLSFYGSFVLVISDPATNSVIAEARELNKRPKKSNAVIDSVLEGDEDVPSLDANKAAVESLIN